MKPFHEMTQAQFVEQLRSLYFAQPKANWDTLAVGNVIVNKYRAWRITHIPPKRGFVMAENALTGDVEKLLRSKFDSADLLLSDEPTLSTLRTSHVEEIRKAMAAGITISPLVQYDYPELFTPYPAEWDEKRREMAHDLWLRINEMRACHDRREGPGWQFARVDYLVEDAEQHIVSWQAYRAEVEAGVKIKKPEVIPGIVANVNQTIRELTERIETLGHLRKHLEKTIRAA
jgi:hypothetical protein